MFTQSFSVWTHICVLHNENHTFFSLILKWSFIFLQIPLLQFDFLYPHVHDIGIEKRDREGAFKSVRFWCGLICISLELYFFSLLSYNKHIFDSKMFIIILEINNVIFFVYMMIVWFYNVINIRKIYEDLIGKNIFSRMWLIKLNIFYLLCVLRKITIKFIC